MRLRGKLSLKYKKNFRGTLVQLFIPTMVKRFSIVASSMVLSWDEGGPCPEVTEPGFLCSYTQDQLLEG